MSQASDVRTAVAVGLWVCGTTLTVLAPFSAALAQPSPQQPPAEGQGVEALADDDFSDFGDEDLEDFEAVDATALQEGDTQGPTWSAFLGYFHSALIHLPIGWLLLVVLSDVAFFVLGSASTLGNLSRPLLGLTILSFIPAIVSGLMRFESLGLAPEDAAPALFHRNLILGAFAALVGAWAIRYFYHLRGRPLVAYLLLIIAAFSLVSFAAHQGGEMVFGEPPPFPL